MKENFNSQEYRDNLATNLKEMRSQGEDGKEEAREFLREEKYSDEYIEAKKEKEFKKNEPESKKIMEGIEKLRESLSPIIKKEIVNLNKNGVEIFSAIRKLAYRLREAGYEVMAGDLDKFLNLSEEEKRSLFIDAHLKGVVDNSRESGSGWKEAESFRADIGYKDSFDDKQEVFSALIKKGNIGDAHSYYFHHIRNGQEKRPLIVDEEALMLLANNAYSGIYYSKNENKRVNINDDRNKISIDKVKELMKESGAKKAKYYGGVWTHYRWLEFGLDF